MKRVWLVLIGVALAVGCAGERHSRRAECVDAVLPRYRACLDRVEQTERACIRRFSVAVASWCAQSLPTGPLSASEIEHYGSACAGTPLGSEPCRYAMEHARAADLHRQCQAEVRLGARAWEAPEALTACRTEAACCGADKGKGLEECEKAARRAVRQCL